MNKKYLSLVLLAVCFFTFSSFNLKENQPKKPKNIILLIGDGMGLSQISYALIESNERMNFERFKVCGFSRTSSSDHKITDSAAGATALSTGKKTYNGAIGVDDQKNPLPTILELAEAQQLSTGLVATCAITHATPASFISHQPSRNMYEEIAADFVKTDIDLFIGGGYNHFAKRKNDKRDITDELKAKGYEVIRSEKELWKYSGDKKVAGLVDAGHLPEIQKGRGDYLEKATDYSMNRLSQNKKGFFLMIEGSQIDWGGHANNAEYIRTEVMDFDRAIGLALDFAEKDGNTLVIVTADHETGGFALSGNEEDKKENKIIPAFTTKNHTATMVPVFAYGPGAEELGGIYQNTHIFEVMKKLLITK